jgi:hypothetical protein
LVVISVALRFACATTAAAAAAADDDDEDGMLPADPVLALAPAFVARLDDDNGGDDDDDGCAAFVAAAAKWAQGCGSTAPGPRW